MTGDVLLVAKQTVERQFNIDLQSALVMIPNLERFQDPFATSVITEALQYAGISPLPGDPDLETRPAPVAAAAAANGIGLCKSYAEVDVCNQEEALLPDSQVLGIEYSNVSLSVFLSPFTLHMLASTSTKFEHGTLVRETAETSEGYWQLVKETIQRLPREWEHKGISDIVVMGESSLNRKFSMR